MRWSLQMRFGDFRRRIRASKGGKISQTGMPEPFMRVEKFSCNKHVRFMLLAVTTRRKCVSPYCHNVQLSFKQRSLCRRVLNGTSMSEMRRRARRLAFLHRQCHCHYEEGLVVPSMATIPRAGPMASKAKAAPHPPASATIGINHNVGTVRVKPIANCNVRAVPT